MEKDFGHIKRKINIFVGDNDIFEIEFRGMYL